MFFRYFNQIMGNRSRLIIRKVFIEFSLDTFDMRKPAISENVVKKLNIPENTVVSVTMWDVPGREDMDLRKTYYRDLDGVIGKAWNFSYKVS